MWRLNLVLLLAVACQLPTRMHAAPSPNSPWGVGSSAESSGAYPMWLPKMARAGVQWVRSFPGWSSIEPKQGSFDFSGVDKFLDAATANGIQATGLLAYNAPWNGNNSHGLPNTTAQLAAWSNYVSKTVAHTKDRVTYWEIWNEPQNFKSDGQNATDYAAVVTAAYKAAKAANPIAKVGMTVASVDIIYLEQTLDAGAAESFDYICVHPYEILGSVDAGQEALFFGIVPTVRKLLHAKAPTKLTAEIQFTELGEALGKTVTNVTQAVSLVKAYTLGIAQGASKIDWFEASGNRYNMGLVDDKGNAHPAYTALQRLTQHLGPTPQFVGWLRWNAPRDEYGFVFADSSDKHVMVAWGPPVNTTVNSRQPIDLGAPLTVLDCVSGESTTTATLTLPDGGTPVLVQSVSPAMVAQAKANGAGPLPWGTYNPSHSNTVSTTMGIPGGGAPGNGLHMLNQQSFPLTPVPLPQQRWTHDEISGNWSCDMSWSGAAAELGRDVGVASAVNFAVDPSFLEFNSAPINITATVRRYADNGNAGFNLKYESATGTGSVGWNTVPGTCPGSNDVPCGPGWHNVSWLVKDDEFVGKWGYEFSFNADVAAQGHYYLQSVSITKQPHEKQGLWEYLEGSS